MPTTKTNSRPDLQPGDVCQLQFDGGTIYKGQEVTVLSVRRDRNCVSGYRVRVQLKAGRQRALDASWLIPKLAARLRRKRDRLTQEEKERIIRLAQTGIVYKAIAKEFNVSTSYVSHLFRHGC